MSSVIRLLHALDGVRQTASDRYVAACPAHVDRSPSLSIRDCDDGRVLVHCFAGCLVEDVVAAVGMTMSDLMPEAFYHHAPAFRTPFDAVQVLEGVSHEVAVIAVIAEEIASGTMLTDEVRKRLLAAARRLSVALQAAPVLKVPDELRRIRKGMAAS